MFIDNAKLTNNKALFLNYCYAIYNLFTIVHQFFVFIQDIIFSFIFSWVYILFLPTEIEISLIKVIYLYDIWFFNILSQNACNYR